MAKISKTFSLEIEDVQYFEELSKTQEISISEAVRMTVKQSKAYREYLRLQEERKQKMKENRENKKQRKIKDFKTS
jgi:hypothetical protein